MNLFRKIPKAPLRRIVFDVECDGLLEELTKMHCFVAFDLDNKEWIITTDPNEAVDTLDDPDVEVIGHYIKMYDLPALKRLTGREINPGAITDTLPLAQYLDPKKLKHGLEVYGEEFGIQKPKIDDWENLTVDDYIHRCREDVKINAKLYVSQMNRLRTLYDNDEAKIQELIGYLTFKFDCLEEQYRNPVSLDFELLFTELFKLTEQRETVKAELMKHMPAVIKTGIKKRPEKYYKKDGTPSVAAERWEQLLQSLGYGPSEAEGLLEVEVVVSEDAPNPDSNDQLKQWLFSLGWEPCTFKSVEDKEKSVAQRRKIYRKVPQISDLDDKTKLTPSVMRLSEVNASVELLAGYSTLKHRVTILEGFIRDSRNGKLVSDASGITNTLRLKHRIIVNLPKPHAAYASHIRECLVAPEGYYMVGADLSGIEDNTKQHYIFPYDPDYVESMRTPGFDPHIRIAELAKMITEEEGSFFKWYEGLSSEEKEKLTDEEHSKYKRIKKVRGDAKPVNFSATYGVGKKKLAMTGGFTEDFAELLLDTYWNLNWAVKKFAEDQEVKTINGQMWIKQPVSGFWYSLRADKDRFSTVNQSTAVFVFDCWVYYLRSLGLQITLQYHDECVVLVKNDIPVVEIEEKIMGAMKKVNELLKLNVEVKCSFDVGNNYKEVH